MRVEEISGDMCRQIRYLRPVGSEPTRQTICGGYQVTDRDIPEGALVNEIEHLSSPVRETQVKPDPTV